MAYSIDIRRAALDFIKEQVPKHQKQIKKKIEALKADPRPPNSKVLSGSDDLRRIRSGYFRIVYTIDDDKLVVVIVGDRKTSGRLPITGDNRYVDLGLVTDSVGVQETAPARCERAVAKS